MSIYFEHCGQYITAAGHDGMVLVRCNFSLTDCRDDEPLDGFIARHGGELGTVEYLKTAYAA